MAQLQTITVSAPGFAGLNTQDSPLEMPVQFAATANNCVIDRSGRIAARQGFNTTTTSGATQVNKLAYYSDEQGNNEVYSCSDSAIYTGTTTLTSVYSTSITDSDWKIVQLNETMYFFQEGHDALQATAGGAPSTVTFSKPAGSPALEGANEALSAYGRLWLADVDGDKQTVWWSDNLDGDEFNSGNAGSIDVGLVWPQGKDEIVALAAHNGFLIVFGRHSTLIYFGPEDPATMALQDAISGVGCVSRNCVQVTGNDLLFLSHLGVASLGRVVQEKSLPEGGISGTVRDDIISQLVSANPKLLRSSYSQEEAWVNFGVIDKAKGVADWYVFDMRRPIDQSGTRRATTWPQSPFLAFDRNCRNGDILCAGVPGVGKYDGYQDDSSTYSMAYYTHQMDFGDPTTLKFLKKIRPVILGTSSNTASIFWGYDFNGTFKGQALPLAQVTGAEFGIGEFGGAEFGRGTALNTLNVNTTGSGTQAAVGLEVTINGTEFSIQELTIYSTIGRKAW